MCIINKYRATKHQAPTVTVLQDKAKANPILNMSISKTFLSEDPLRVLSLAKHRRINRAQKRCVFPEAT
jgi:hypothetical protein